MLKTCAALLCFSLSLNCYGFVYTFVGAMNDGRPISGFMDADMEHPTLSSAGISIDTRDWSFTIGETTFDRSNSANFADPFRIPIRSAQGKFNIYPQPSLFDEGRQVFTLVEGGQMLRYGSGIILHDPITFAALFQVPEVSIYWHLLLIAAAFLALRCCVSGRAWGVAAP